MMAVNILFIVVLMNAICLNTRLFYGLHLHGTDAPFNGASQISQCSLIEVGPPIPLPLDCSQRFRYDGLDPTVHTTDDCSPERTVTVCMSPSTWYNVE